MLTDLELSNQKWCWGRLRFGRSSMIFGLAGTTPHVPDDNLNTHTHTHAYTFNTTLLFGVDADVLLCPAHARASRCSSQDGGPHSQGRLQLPSTKTLTDSFEMRSHAARTTTTAPALIYTTTKPAPTAGPSVQTNHGV